MAKRHRHKLYPFYMIRKACVRAGGILYIDNFTKTATCKLPSGAWAKIIGNYYLEARTADGRKIHAEFVTKIVPGNGKLLITTKDGIFEI